MWILTRRMGDSDHLGNKASSQSDVFQMARRNTLKTFLLVSICFVLCWSCAQFNYLLYNLGFELDFNGTLNKVFILAAFGNCTINPFVYLFKYRDYQTALKDLLNFRQIASNQQMGNLSSNSTSLTFASTVSNELS